VSLIIQSVLGGADIPVPDSAPWLHTQIQQDQNGIFHNIKRLLRCIIDFSLTKGDSTAARNGLMAFRSISAAGWDDGPMQMKQIEGFGLASVRKLSAAGITSLEILEDTDAHKLESVLKKQPPFGRKLLDKMKSFPKLRVSIQMLGRMVSVLSLNAVLF